MIRVIMLGRMGNNLFQYAFGRALSIRYGVPLVLDASWFNGRTWPYVETLRRLPGMASGRAQVVRPFSFGSRILRKVTKRHHWEFLGKPVIRERESDHSFDSNLLTSPPDCVAFGYFQSPHYFHHIDALLREELATAGMGLEKGLERLAERLLKPSSVAVHVRRTDYINNPNLILLNMQYYQRAMNHMRKTVPNPRFLIFSDDPDWCLKNFKRGDVEVCTHSDPFSPLQDLHLMSLASHHIIANSSFSWWAAWLGSKPGQQVLIPDRWFKGGIHAPAEEKLLPAWSLVSTSDFPK